MVDNCAVLSLLIKAVFNKTFLANFFFAKLANLWKFGLLPKYQVFFAKRNLGIFSVVLRSQVYGNLHLPLFAIIRIWTCYFET